MAVAAFEYEKADSSGERSTLPEEHAAVLAYDDSPFYIGAYPGVLQALAIAMDPLIEAFKSIYTSVLYIENQLFRFYKLTP